MSYAEDEMIAAEDAITNALSAKTAEELTQVMRVLDQVDQTPTLAALPDFSSLAIGGEILASHDEGGVRVVDRFNMTDASFVDFKTRGEPRDSRQEDAYRAMFCPDQESVRRFSAARDLPSALDEGQLTRAEWGTMNVGHPVVVAALAEAEDSERMSRKYGAAYPYRCNECLANGKREVFPWAGALFVHLLTCPHFAADVAGSV